MQIRKFFYISLYEAYMSKIIVYIFNTQTVWYTKNVFISSSRFKFHFYFYSDNKRSRLCMYSTVLLPLASLLYVFILATRLHI